MYDLRLNIEKYTSSIFGRQKTLLKIFDLVVRIYSWWNDFLIKKKEELELKGTSEKQIKKEMIKYVPPYLTPIKNNMDEEKMKQLKKKFSQKGGNYGYGNDYGYNRHSFACERLGDFPKIVLCNIIGLILLVAGGLIYYGVKEIYKTGKNYKSPNRIALEDEEYEKMVIEETKKMEKMMEEEEKWKRIKRKRKIREEKNKQKRKEREEKKRRIKEKKMNIFVK